MTPLPFDAYEVQQMLKDHDTRIKRGATLNPSSGILPGKALPMNNSNMTKQQRPRLPALRECIQYTIPSTFTTQFHISRTIPNFNPSYNNAMHNFCSKKRDGSIGFRFAFHIVDDSTEIDVLCLGAVAEKLIGTKAQAIVATETSRKKAVGTLNDIMTPGWTYEGEIRSVLGKDNKVYYILKSMRCLLEDACHI